MKKALLFAVLLLGACASKGPGIPEDEYPPLKPVSHLDLNRAPSRVVEGELRASRDSLEQALGAPVDGLAYPYSRFNPQVKALVRRAGELQLLESPGD